MAASAFLSLITLGVSDIKRSRAFYEALGWKASSASNETVTFFHGANGTLALYPRHLLAEDAGVSDKPTGFAGITLANNMPSEAEVDALIARAKAAGGSVVKPAQKVFWGGYSGYFSDPDGHLWEVAHNPFFPIAEDGKLRLPP
ncbi:VOC family protein [Terrarubrum flagellatum]|uniref:VOC family protein n=1 Tax=Terrirubrum flagellatum TaxID=2895980 RepID=UPI0031450C7E